MHRSLNRMLAGDSGSLRIKWLIGLSRGRANWSEYLEPSAMWTGFDRVGSTYEAAVAQVVGLAGSQGHFI